MKKLSKTARAKTRKALWKDLAWQVLGGKPGEGRLNSVTGDLIDQYLDARERLIDCTEAIREAREQGLAPEETQELEATANATTMAMAAILDQLRVMPKSTRRQELEEEILGQLRTRGLVSEVFADRVDQFLKLWDAFQDAVKSLAGRGRTYFTISSAGKTYEKDNSASKDMVTLAKAMGDILDELGVTVDGYADAEDMSL